MPDPSVVLVTGASSGNGAAIAALLAERGYRVFGTSRQPARARQASGFDLVELDVRSEESAHACVAAVLERAGRLDVLVNNAGYELAGAIEETSLDEARAQFDTNFFGVMRMVKAALPHMRERRSGRIVNISSLAGLATTPFMSMYSASKFALESFTAALRIEVRPFGIHVSEVEAGFLDTPMKTHRQHAAQRIADYDAARDRAFESIAEQETRGPGPELVAHAVLRIAGSPNPRLRYLIGRQARSVALLQRFLPDELFQQGLKRTFRLDTVPAARR